MSVFFIALPLELFNLISNYDPLKSYSRLRSTASIGWGGFVSATWGMSIKTEQNPFANAGK